MDAKALTESSDSNSVWWEDFNEILAIRARLGKHVRQLFLIGEWAGMNAQAMDIDKIAVARTYSLVEEFIDERAFPGILYN